VAVPSSSTADEARRSVRYPPDSIRGVARGTRAAGFSLEFDDDFRSATTV